MFEDQFSLASRYGHYSMSSSYFKTNHLLRSVKVLFIWMLPYTIVKVAADSRGDSRVDPQTTHRCYDEIHYQYQYRRIKNWH